jgi:hypothetical protein
VGRTTETREHPKTGAARLIEVREMKQKIIVPRYVEEKRPRRRHRIKF